MKYEKRINFNGDIINQLEQTSGYNKTYCFEFIISGVSLKHMRYPRIYIASELRKHRYNLRKIIGEL